MREKCHFAHSKEELRGAGDPLPLDAPYITDAKVSIMSVVGIGCLSYSPEIVERLMELGLPIQDENFNNHNHRDFEPSSQLSLTRSKSSQPPLPSPRDL